MNPAAGDCHALPIVSRAREPIRDDRTPDADRKRSHRLAGRQRPQRRRRGVLPCTDLPGEHASRRERRASRAGCKRAWSASWRCWLPPGPTRRSSRSERSRRNSRSWCGRSRRPDTRSACHGYRHVAVSGQAAGCVPCGRAPRQAPARGRQRGRGPRLPGAQLLDRAEAGVGVRHLTGGRISIRLQHLSHPARPVWAAECAPLPLRDPPARIRSGCSSSRSGRCDAEA